MDSPTNLLLRTFGDPLPSEWEHLSAEVRLRLCRLVEASPLYAQLLRRSPAWLLWLEDDRNLRDTFRYQALLQEWRSFAAATGENLADTTRYLDRLRQWRRMMSLRIAYRRVNGLADERTTVEELTRLAEYCIRECHLLAAKSSAQRYGDPWDDDLQRPARFCVLALGKLGGQELNFSSDVDLVFLYEGDGYCRREGKAARFTSVEYFTKLAESTTQWLTVDTEAGFLFRVDTRLRPEGAYGPLVRSFTSMENYYAVAGQTWERMAWLKARPVAGDLALGSELLESLQSFRYPRHPPPTLLSEVAETKLRTEREIIGAEALDRDVKSGRGGIREIEFVVQTLQLLHAGRYPFLQTHSTEAALQALVRYDLMDSQRAEQLIEHYWFLREVENRLQMREEQQTHTLPPAGEPLELIAHSLGFADAQDFERALSDVTKHVHAVYQDLFPDRANQDDAFGAWWTFFTSARVPPVVAGRLHHWFGNEKDGALELRRFVCGEPTRVVTRGQIQSFEHIATSLDTILPDLARPVETLQRLARFAERYASRAQFFASCASNPQFFRVLALLFDRSEFVHELLCAHPEIFEEVLRPEILRQRKDADMLRQDLAAGPSDAEPFGRWLRLYVLAEQVRYAIAELLGFITVVELEAALTQLADAAFRELCNRTPNTDRLLLVALGKYGGVELTFGSDLDVMFLTDASDVVAVERAARSALLLFRGEPGLPGIFQIDTRLRPHGDAGPLVATLSAFRDYHASNAQLWERQLLTRARVVFGFAELAQAWENLRHEVLYDAALPRDAAEQIWTTRLRIERERDTTVPPERAFKTGSGGLLDHEFFVQLYQLQFGRDHSALRGPGTRAGLTALAALGLVPGEPAAELLENYEFLKRIEIALRRDRNQAVSVIPADASSLARWLGFSSENAFWEEHRARCRRTRELVLAHAFRGPGPSLTPSAA